MLKFTVPGYQKRGANGTPYKSILWERWHPAWGSAGDAPRASVLGVENSPPGGRPEIRPGARVAQTGARSPVNLTTVLHFRIVILALPGPAQIVPQQGAPPRAKDRNVELRTKKKNLKDENKTLKD